MWKTKRQSSWTETEVEFLREHYPNQGRQWCADKLGKSAARVSAKASQYRIFVTPETKKRTVSGFLSIRMKADNPSKRPGATEGLRQRSSNRPDVLAKLRAGQARLQCDKPSGLERKLWAILTNLGIAFEHTVEIKSKFLVDVRIDSLIIEADGDWWHGHPRFEPLNERQLHQQARDFARDNYLRACGYVVVRIWERDMSVETVSSILKHHNLLAA